MVKLNQRFKCLITGTALLSVLGGCATPPDLKEADLAKSMGHYSEAEAIYLELSKLGVPQAQISLGDMYFQGEGFVQDQRKALYWYSEASATKSPRGMQRYAKALLRDTNYHRPDPKQAKQLLLDLWEYEGKNTVALDLGRLIVEFPEAGTGDEALQWLSLALESGKVEANYYLGLLYIRADLIEPDVIKARDYFVAALDSYPLAAHELLAVYAHNPELGDLQELLDSLIKRNSFEGGKAAYHLGRIYEQGDLLPVNPTKAEHFYLKAVDGFPQATIALAKLYTRYPEIDPDNSVFEWIARAEKAGFTEKAKLLKARVLYEGKLLPGEPEKAEEIYLSLSDYSSEAAYHLGMLYKLGYLGESDYPNSYKYFINSARMGMPRGDFQVAEMFTKGRVIKPNLSKAYAHYQLASEGEYDRANQSLEEIKQVMSAQQIASAENYVEQELRIRMSVLSYRPVTIAKGINE